MLKNVKFQFFYKKVNNKNLSVLVRLERDEINKF
ncbi:hypothetical protein B0I27_1157 [Arcticibacter pallidicorallinus]|uniref:Uncharacterized protein n=1 Tax=Arcticibacter pallidicorallinus TaxID=1259464 RepID=A0A2T0TRJ7_9SPHI|nr:hypothetical protein B0I27_1157 [Arcticibacter pallidicorallinus]